MENALKSIRAADLPTAGDYKGTTFIASIGGVRRPNNDTASVALLSGFEVFNAADFEAATGGAAVS
jgi:hypothetical protein